MIINYRISNPNLDCISFLIPADHEDAVNLAIISSIWHVFGISGDYPESYHAFVGDVAEMRLFMKNLEVLGYTFVERRVYGWE